MTPAVQSLIALALVALAAIWLVRRSFAKKKAGCAGDCGCPASEVKSAAAAVTRRK